MTRKKLRSQTEWLVNSFEPGSEFAHSVFVYRLQSSVDETTGRSTLHKLWVAARGYAGRGDYEQYSAVMFPEGDGYRVVGCDYAFPDPGDFEEEEDHYLKRNDVKVMLSLWTKSKKLVLEKEENDGAYSTYKLKFDIPRRSDSAHSDQWDGNVLVQVSKRWRLGTRFEDQRSKRERARHPLVPLLPRPASLDDF